MEFKLYFRAKSPYYTPAWIPEKLVSFKEIRETLGDVNLENILEWAPAHRIRCGDYIVIPESVAIESGLFQSSQAFIVVDHLALNKYLVLTPKDKNGLICWEYEFNKEGFLSDWRDKGYPRLWE